jgi:hypothetical protein
MTRYEQHACSPVLIVKFHQHENLREFTARPKRASAQALLSISK